MSLAEQITRTPIYDLDMARDFFRMIERDGSFMLQTFDDVPSGVKSDRSLASTVLWPAGDPCRTGTGLEQYISPLCRRRRCFLHHQSD